MTELTAVNFFFPPRSANLCTRRGPLLPDWSVSSLVCWDRSLSSGILSGGVSGRQRYWACWCSRALWARRFPCGRAVRRSESLDNRYSACEVLSLIVICALGWASATNPHFIKWRCWGVSEATRPRTALTLLKGSKGQMDLLLFLPLLRFLPPPSKKRPVFLLCRCSGGWRPNRMLEYLGQKPTECCAPPEGCGSPNPLFLLLFSL